jgi:hypothetical protein
MEFLKQEGQVKRDVKKSAKILRREENDDTKGPQAGGCGSFLPRIEGIAKCPG